MHQAAQLLVAGLLAKGADADKAEAAAAVPLSNKWAFSLVLF